MQISTTYNGTLITGVVLKHKPYFLEVQITSPYTKMATSRSVPTFARNHIRYQGETFTKRCEELLVEIYKVASAKVA